MNSYSRVLLSLTDSCVAIIFISVLSVYGVSNMYSVCSEGTGRELKNAQGNSYTIRRLIFSGEDITFIKNMIQESMH